MPITWRNIQGGNGAVAAGQLLNAAQNSVNTGLDKITDVFAQYRETDRANWENGKENNTQAFLDRLAQYKTPEELAAAQAAGEIQAFRQQFGNKIDAAQVRDAEANMQQKLIERITAQNQYGDDKINRDARPLVDQFNALRAAGKLDEAQKFLEDNVLGVDESPYAQSLLDRRDKVFDQGIAQGNLAVNQGQLGVSQGNLRLSQDRNGREQTLFNQSQDKYKREDQARRELEEGNRLVANLTTQIGQSYIDDARIPTETIETVKTDLLGQLGKITQNPEIRDKLLASFDTRLAEAHKLSTQGQGLEALRTAGIDLGNKVALDRVEQAYRSELANNPLVSTEVKDPEVTVDKLIKETGGDGWDGGEYKRLMSKGKSLLNSEIEVKTDKGPVKIKVTEGMLREALKTVDSSWSLRNAGYEDELLQEAIEDMVKADGFAKRWTAAQEVHQRYVQDVEDLKSLHTQSTLDAVDKLRKELYPRR